MLNSSPIQHILFPTHPLSPTSPKLPRRNPKCKGFALVTLTEPYPCPTPRLTLPLQHPHKCPPPTPRPPEEELEARKAGLRALSKEPWVRLQAEYAEYRESLLRRIAAGKYTPTPDKIKCTQHGSAPTAQPPQPMSEPQSQSFPAGCVLLRGMCLQARTKLHYAPVFCIARGPWCA